MSKRKADMKITIGLFNTRGQYHKQASHSGYDVHVAGAVTGVKVMPRVHPETGEVTYEIWATDGRYRGANDKMVGRLVNGQLDRINPATMEPYDG
jgi:hypothetical protein